MAVDRNYWMRNSNQKYSWNSVFFPLLLLKKGGEMWFISLEVAILNVYVIVHCILSCDSALAKSPFYEIPTEARFMERNGMQLR